MRRLRRVVVKEAIGYARTAALMARPHRTPRRRPAAPAAKGALYVHGLGTTCAQFAAMDRALNAHVAFSESFDYNSGAAIDRTAVELREVIEAASAHTEKLVLIGHSLGGLVLRQALQLDETPPDGVAWVSICAPLRGTLSGTLSSLGPKNSRFTRLAETAHRLEGVPTLCVGSRFDHFIFPAENAFLDEHPRLELEDVGHVGALFDPRVHAAIRDLIDTL